MNWKRLLGCFLATGLAGFILIPELHAVLPNYDTTLRQLWDSILDMVSRIDTSVMLIITIALALYVCFAMGICGMVSSCTKTIWNYIMGDTVPPSDIVEVVQEEATNQSRRASPSLATLSPDQSRDDISPAVSIPKLQTRYGKSTKTCSSMTEGRANEGSTEDTEERSKKSLTPVSSRESTHSVGSSSHDSCTSVTGETKVEVEFVKPTRRTRSDAGLKGTPSSYDISSTQSDVGVQVSPYYFRHPRTTRATSTSPAATKSRGTSTRGRNLAVTRAISHDSIIMPPPPPPDVATGPYFLRRGRTRSSTPRGQKGTVSRVSTPDSSSEEEHLSRGSAPEAKEKQD